MGGGGLRVTMPIFFVTMAIAFVVVLSESKSSPLDTSPATVVGMVERMGLRTGATAKGDFCNRRYAARHSSNQGWKGCHETAHVSEHTLDLHHGRDLITMSNARLNERKTTSSANLSAEVEALIAFKEGVTDDPLGALSSWNSNDSSSCHWNGVTCSLPSKHIIALELGNMELVGSISPLVGRLQFLQNLNLSSNFFNGDIPTSLSNCSYLSHLSLSGNNLTGQIPSQLGDLINLQSLDLSNNALVSGTIPTSLGNCSSLRFLFLEYINVNGSIPYTVGQLTNLERLGLSRTLLSGAVPRSLGNCSSLTHLSMGNYDDTELRLGLSGELPMEMGSLTRLTLLTVDGSSIAGRFPRWIANLTRLSSLYLTRNSFSGEVPNLFGQLSLEQFDVEENYFTGAFPVSLTNCSNLEAIAVSGNSFVGPIPTELGLLNQLSDISMADNNFSGIIPSSLANCSAGMTWLQLGQNPFEAQTFPPWVVSFVNLTLLYFAQMKLQGAIPLDVGKLSNIQTLELSINNLSGSLPATIGNCTSLLLLDLQVNRLSGELPSEIWLLSQLQYLLVSANFLTGALPASIGNMSQLQEFYCPDNNLTGAIPTEIGLLRNLGTLDMDSNFFYGYIPQSLGNSSSINVLDLSENYLTGSIPASMGNLTQLQILYICKNPLQGPIPADLMRCTSLFDLELYGNSLNGSIPEDIGKLQSLVTLFLNNNINLSGVLPDSLGMCIHLTYVDLSHNSFYGVLPSGVFAQMSRTLSSWNVSHNMLSGSLPQELSQLSTVTYLDFSANNFSGSIPSGLGECESMISLDLSINNLSGSIPQTLVQLKDLAYLNLSDNNLEGPIPEGGIFATKNVTAASFFGNDGLCGSILGRACAVLAPSRSVAASTCRGFHCTSIRITVGCSAAGLLLAILFLVYWLLFYRGKTDEGEQDMVSFECGFKVSKEDLVTIMANPENVIRVGANSTIYEGFLGGDKAVAIKALSIPADESSHDYKQAKADLLREAHILSKLKHRNILKFLGLFCFQDVVALISEFMPRASLNDQLYPSVDDDSEICELNWDARLNIALGIAQGLVYLHSQLNEPVIHRDLKPSNVFLDTDLTPKLGDFGVSRFANPDRDGEKSASNFCGTLGYIPPEYGATTLVSTKGDVYSYGVTLLELLTRKHPIPAEGSESGHECGNLVDWVRESFEEEPLAIVDNDLIDENLDKENQREQIRLLLRVGLLCTRREPQNRPAMTDVVAMVNQVIERGLDPIGHPSVTQLAEEITVWNTPEHPTASTSRSL